MDDTGIRRLFQWKNYRMLLALFSITLLTVFTYFEILRFPLLTPGGYLDHFVLMLPGNDIDSYTLLERIKHYLKATEPPRICLLKAVNAYIPYKLWGLSPYHYHLLALGIYSAICFEIFLLYQLLFKNFAMSLSCSLLYTVFYLNCQVVLNEGCSIMDAPGILWALAGTILYLSYPNTWKVTLLTCMFYLASILCTEKAMFYPVILFLLCQYLNRKPKLREFYPFLATFLLYFLGVLCSHFLTGQRMTTETKAGLGFVIDTFHWNMVYSLYPYCFGNINLFNGILTHLYVLAIPIVYLLTRDAEIRIRLRILFLCAAISFILPSIFGRSIEARYAAFPLVFTIPIFYTLLSEMSSRIFPSKTPAQFFTTLIIVLAIYSNYVSTQRILGAYKETIEACRRDLDNGSITYMQRTCIEPDFMSFDWDSRLVTDVYKRYNLFEKERKIMQKD